MTVARLELVARPAPELVERVCRVLRHRGATMQRLLAETGEADGRPCLRIDVTVHVTGDVDLLARQVGRLTDVGQVRVLAAPDGHVVPTPAGHGRAS